MPTKTRPKAALSPELEDLPEVEYLPEEMGKLDKFFEIAEAQIAAGEYVPKTLAELAAEYGIKANAI